VIALSCRDVVVERDGRRLVDGVSLDVAAGEWLCVAGPNGAGKTTLLRALLGIVAAAGSVEVLGRPLGSLRPRERARLLALVPQVPVVPPGMRVLDYVLLGRTPYLSLLGVERPPDLDAARTSLDRLGLHALAARTVDSLSGGERQRVLVARALAQDAPLLLLDEPTTSLDIGHQQEVLELVDDLRLERGFTVVSTLHDLTLAGQYADRLVLLRDGAIVESGRPADVITTENLSRYYGAHVAVVDGPYGRVIVPQRPIPEGVP
jgi:iron complex transport system ATP-binding protein